MNENEDQSTPKKAGKSKRAVFNFEREVFFANKGDLLKYKDKYTHLVFEKLSTKEILSELEEIESFSQYLKSIDLRYKGFSKKSHAYSRIDTILEMFSLKAKNIEILKLSINQSEINDQVMFKNIEKLTKLDSFSLNLNTSSFPTSLLVGILKQLEGKSLKKFCLSLSQCDYDKAIFDQLKFFNTLESLKLNLSDNQRDEFSFECINQILDNNPHLTEINFNLNHISKFIEFDNFLISLLKLKDNIKSVKLMAYGNNLTVEETIKLCDHLSKMENLKIIKIDLRKNYLNGIYEEDEKYKKLFQGIEGLKSHLRGPIEDPSNLKIFY